MFVSRIKTFKCTSLILHDLSALSERRPDIRIYKRTVLILFRKWTKDKRVNILMGFPVSLRQAWCALESPVYIVCVKDNCKNITRNLKKNEN